MSPAYTKVWACAHPLRALARIVSNCLDANNSSTRISATRDVFSKMLFGLALLGAVSAQQVNTSSPLIAETNVGTFQGVYSTPDAVRAWLGIPFGKPTNGTRRFRPPQRADVLPRDSIFNASSLGPACPNIGNAGGEGPAVSENCLSINVWAPDVAKLNSSGTPVLVWIYGKQYFADDWDYY